MFMANSYRKSTLKFTFSTEYARPRALEVERFLREDVKIPCTDLIGIHLSIVSSVVYVKLVNDTACNTILERAKDGLKFRHSDGNIGPVNVDHAGLGLRTIRIFELPFELPAEDVEAALRPYGKVLSHVAEKWTQFTTYPVLNGVRQVRIELTKHVPSYLNIAGCRAIVIYDGQPKTCSGCGKEGHIRSECLQRRIAQLQSTDPLPPTTPTILPLTYVAALRTDAGQIHEPEQLQDLSEITVSGRDEEERLTTNTVSPPAAPTQEKVEEKTYDKMEVDQLVVPTAAFVPDRRDSIPSSDTETHTRKQRSPKKTKKRKKASSDEASTQDNETSSHHTELVTNPSTTDCDMSSTTGPVTALHIQSVQRTSDDQHDKRSPECSELPLQLQGKALEDARIQSTAWADEVPESSAEDAVSTAASTAHDKQNV